MNIQAGESRVDRAPVRAIVCGEKNAARGPGKELCARCCQRRDVCIRQAGVHFHPRNTIVRRTKNAVDEGAHEDIPARNGETRNVPAVRTVGLNPLSLQRPLRQEKQEEGQE